MTRSPEAINGPRARFDEIHDDWVALALAMNRLNRSMGLQDAYPFTLVPNVIEKLRFVHHLVENYAVN